MRKSKLIQLAANFFIILSLFVSSLAACCCPHHRVKSETETPACHQTSRESRNQTADDSAQEESPKHALDLACECFMEAAPKVFSKSQTVKIEKQVLGFRNPGEIIGRFVETRSPAPPRFDFSPFRLTDSFSVLKSPRAPPRLPVEKS